MGGGKEKEPRPRGDNWSNATMHNFCKSENSEQRDVMRLNWFDPIGLMSEQVTFYTKTTIIKFNKTARIRAKPRLFRLPFKVYGAVITLKS